MDGTSALGLLSLLSTSAWIATVWFLLAAFVLDLFDISLPRGDAIGVSGALSAAALVVLGLPEAIVVCFGAALLAISVRPRTQSGRRISTMLLGRAGGLVAAVLVDLILQRQAGSAPAWTLLALVPAAFLLAELAVAQAVLAVGTGRPVLRLLRGSLAMQAPLLVAQWSASVLLLITYGWMGSWSLILVVVLLLLMRQSYAVLLEIRETYRTTVEVVVEAAESQDARRIGHAERTAENARLIAMRLGLTFSEVERISYAALLHDVGALSMRSDQGAMTTSGVSADAKSGSMVFEGVEFFSDVLPILSICEGRTPPDQSEANLLAAMIVALASDADAADNPAVAEVHSGSAVATVAPRVSGAAKAAVVASALSLGFKTPAVS